MSTSWPRENSEELQHAGISARAFVDVSLGGLRALLFWGLALAPQRQGNTVPSCRTLKSLTRSPTAVAFKLRSAEPSGFSDSLPGTSFGDGQTILYWLWGSHLTDPLSVWVGCTPMTMLFVGSRLLFSSAVVCVLIGCCLCHTGC